MGNTRRRNGETDVSMQAVTFVKGDRAVDVTLRFGREGRAVTAQCIELGTATFGDNQQEAEAAIIEAVALDLQTLEDHGELERVLSKNGLQIRTFEPAWLPSRESVPA